MKFAPRGMRTCKLNHSRVRFLFSCFCFETMGLLREGFEYVTYNDVDDLRRVVKRINRRGRIRSLFGRPRRAVAAIMMEALQVSSVALRQVNCVAHATVHRQCSA